MNKRLVLLGVSLAMVLLAACKEETGFRKETFPVTGEVFVDGKPASGVQVTLNDVKGFDQEHPTFSQAMTDDNGKFAVSTYEQADGVPEGEYIVTFMWGQLNMINMQYGGPDKLKDRYVDPKKSTYRIKVQSGTPADMGRVELTTTDDAPKAS